MWHKKCSILAWICLILIIIGGINWGLVGIFGFNLVAFLFGSWPIIERVIYIIVGIAAVIAIFLGCSCCGRGTCSPCKGGVCSCQGKCTCRCCGKGSYQTGTHERLPLEEPGEGPKGPGPGPI